MYNNIIHINLRFRYLSFEGFSWRKQQLDVLALSFHSFGKNTGGQGHLLLHTASLQMFCYKSHKSYRNAKYAYKQCGYYLPASKSQRFLLLHSSFRDLQAAEYTLVHQECVMLIYVFGCGIFSNLYRLLHHFHCYSLLSPPLYSVLFCETLPLIAYTAYPSNTLTCIDC